MEYLWWQYGTIYQVYPRSFQDSNGDGVGDLQGIIHRIDHLQTLGITAIWLSPVFPSPMADFGYDISDYCGIHPLFGTMQDMDALITELHKRSMKIILDLVPNHTSDQHPWFIESASSRDNPRHDWYLWQDKPAEGGYPNNWLSVFGGPAWEWNEKRQQYYYHAFLKQQPDLNWRNPEVKKAMLNVMRFWLDKGVDGFRVDVMWHMIKDAELRNNPVNPEYKSYMADYEQLLPVYSTDQPEVHGIVRDMRALLDQYDERMMIGEIYLPIHKLVTYYGTDEREAHLPFNFQLISLPWSAEQIAVAIDQYEAELPDHGWPNWVLGNHDQPRITSRVGIQQARVAAMLLLTLRGTPTIYYGDELGMRDVPVPPDQVQDPQGLNMPGKNLSRDPQRTPMQWDRSTNAGFTTGKPWLPLDKAFPRNNVEVQRDDSYSMFALYSELLRLRQSEPSLNVGHYKPVYSDTQMLAFTRQADGDKKFLVVLNLTHKPCYFDASKFHLEGKVVLGSVPELEGQKVSGSLNLGGDEGVVVECSA